MNVSKLVVGLLVGLACASAASAPVDSGTDDQANNVVQQVIETCSAYGHVAEKIEFLRQLGNNPADDPSVKPLLQDTVVQTIFARAMVRPLVVRNRILDDSKEFGTMVTNSCIESIANAGSK